MFAQFKFRRNAYGSITLFALLVSACSSDGAPAPSDSPRDVDSADTPDADATKVQQIESDSDASSDASSQTKDASRGAPSTSECHGYDAIAKAECADVHAPNGSWLAQKLFSEAPADFPACRYVWRSATTTEPTSADIAMLEPNTDAMHEIDDCQPPTTLASDLNQLSTAGPSGITPGCDVCGRVIGNRLWLVNSSNQFDTLAVPLTNGLNAFFEIPVSKGTMSIRAKLPEAPQGTSYVAGPARVFQPR